MSDTSLADSVLNFVRTELARRLKLPVEKIDSSSQFIDLGLQSIDAVMMCGEVEDHFQIELDPSAIFQFETVGSFVDEVVRRHAN
ncbi:acyl carrier protein [Breoghania sp.]|uniref:acyl carrier protein n=1 Tax=Breoghania sp. TaxID=2065378 RepID=UPI0029CA3C68|nr:acyl carrier protein [Breoghania sp.]